MLRILLINTLVKPVWDRRWLWLLYIALWFLARLFPGYSSIARNLFLIFGLAVFTIPHAAADFYLPAWILNPPWTRRLSYWILGLGSAAILGFITWLLWHLSINFSIALFSAVIMWHWGSLDAIHIYPARGPAWVTGSIGRGMLVLMAPLYFKPLETRELILNLIGTDQSFILTTLYSFSAYLLALAVVLEITAALVNKFAEGRGLPPAFAAHWAETIILLITFATVAPILSLTFYFLILHPLRHMVRIPPYIPEARGQVIEGIDHLRNLSYYFQRTNLVTFLAIFLLFLWFAWHLFSGSSLNDASIACLLPLLLLLIPHALISLLADFNPKQFEG